jgi:hypothetical protein
VVGETRQRSFRGISGRLAREYLTRLGGEVDAQGHVRGGDWEASIAEELIEVGPSLELTEVQISFEGEAEVLDELIETFARKAMRAGG